MAAGRWYPSVTPLTNGEMLITSGRVSTPEVRKTDGTLRPLSSASLSLPLYPWMDVAPDGRVFYSGPDTTLRKLDPAGTGSWQTFGQRDAINRDYGRHAVFDIGKTLVAGGGGSSNDARVEQRYVPLSFTAGSGTLTATVPANLNVAVPGVYMLFIVDSAGVPSVARMLALDPSVQPPPPPPPPPPPTNQPPTVSLTSPANGASFTSPAKVTLAATASDSDGSVVRVQFFNGTTLLGEDTTAPYTTQWNTGAAGTYTLTARATDNSGAVTTSNSATITVKKKR